MDSSNHGDEISAADELRNSGITQTSTDGTSTSFDPKVVGKRRRDLANQDLASIAAGTNRPLIINARMRG